MVDCANPLVSVLAEFLRPASGPLSTEKVTTTPGRGAAILPVGDFQPLTCAVRTAVLDPTFSVPGAATGSSLSSTRAARNSGTLLIFGSVRVVAAAAGLVPVTPAISAPAAIATAASRWRRISFRVGS